MNYIIVAPHSYCLTFKTRVCDKLAYKAAQFFAEFFNSKNHKLYDKLGEKYIIISGIDNDIQKEMRNMGIPTILIEFYEGLPIKELQKLCNDIGKELVEFYINNNN